MYKEFKFRTLKAAKVKQKKMRNLYGYTPSVFKVTHPIRNTKFFVVVKPKGLKKMK